MADAAAFPRYIFGLHEPGGEWLMAEKGRRGWIVFTHELGRDPNNRSGHDYRPWTDRGYGAIARLNHGYGAAGTIPLPQHYDAFAQRVANFVAASPGCHVWVIGNEMNHQQERPEGQPIAPEQYARCYAKCWERIHALAGHDQDQVAIGPVAPWNAATTYASNESGDWVRYFGDAIDAILALGARIGAVALHTYTHGTDPNLVFSGQKMNPPFHNRHYNFRAYQDFMSAIPPALRHLPVYITETDQNDPWENANRGWVRNAYREIHAWNSTLGHQQIRALVLYRWPKYDQWYIVGKGGVYDDFRAAMDNEYVWREMAPPRRIDGHTVQGGFLDFYLRIGETWIGKPVSDEVVEAGLRTQYFERMVLQQDWTGAITLRDAGAEVLRLRAQLAELQAELNQARDQVSETEQQVHQLQEQVSALESEVVPLRERASALEQQVSALQQEREALKRRIAELEKELEACEPGTAPQTITEVVRPAWGNTVYQLVRDPVNEYPQRSLSGVQVLTVTHTAVSPTVTAAEVARFHVDHMKWPGIGYHFFIDAQGRVQRTNELTAACYHVQQWDPVSISIGVAGNFTEVVPTAAQIANTAHLLAWLLQELNLPIDAVKGKQELVDTQSPGYQWLAGKVWKNMLLDQIKTMQAQRVVEHTPLPLAHYMLFWGSGAGWASEEWQGAQPYIARFRPTHGFSLAEARLARYVTIVGNTSGIGMDVERALIVAGCRVERIAGTTPAETCEILRRMAERGQRFMNLIV
ncbi:MAG: N-acetylmuramoyl-L-alanine amidase [Anaerolineae bacterium]|nr:N-acetylmuramoyl-L-alanine amidase [Anaerolineae bacterium]